MNKVLEVVIREATDIEKEAAITSQSHFLTGRRWEHINLWIGIPATLLAASTGVSAYQAPSQAITAGIAMLVASLTALNTFLNPGDRATAHRSAKVTFSRIRREASLLRDVEAPMVEDTDQDGAKQIVERLRELVEEITNADQSAPALMASSKAKAEKILGKQFSA